MILKSRKRKKNIAVFNQQMKYISSLIRCIVEMQRYDLNTAGMKHNKTRMDRIIQFNYDLMFDDTNHKMKERCT